MTNLSQCCKFLASFRLRQVFYHRSVKLIGIKLLSLSYCDQEIRNISREAGGVWGRSSCPESDRAKLVPCGAKLRPWIKIVADEVRTLQGRAPQLTGAGRNMDRQRACSERNRLRLIFMRSRSCAPLALRSIPVQLQSK